MGDPAVCPRAVPTQGQGRAEHRRPLVPPALAPGAGRLRCPGLCCATSALLGDGGVCACTCVRAQSCQGCASVCVRMHCAYVSARVHDCKAVCSESV